MPSVNIDAEKSNEPGPLTRIARKLCCCRSSVKPETSVELTKAQIVTEQPTSSRISVVNKDVFEDDKNDFQTVELQVPDSNGNESQKNANKKCAKKEKRAKKSKKLELIDASAEEIPPDTEFLNVVEEASDLDASTRPTNSSTEQRDDHSTDETALQPDSNHSTNDVISIFQTTAPIENGDFKVYTLSRQCEAGETAEKPAVCSPQKPPRRASQLLSATSFKPTNENAVAAATDNDGTDVDTQCTNSTDDGIVPDITLGNEQENVQKLLANELNEEKGNDENKLTTAISENEQNVEFSSVPSEEQTIAVDYTDGNTRTIATMAIDDTLESDYEDSLSTTMTDKSFAEDGNGNEFVTRLSVRSNGDVLVSSPTFNGPVVKVKLSSIGENNQNITYKDHDLSENLV